MFVTKTVKVTNRVPNNTASATGTTRVVRRIARTSKAAKRATAKPCAGCAAPGLRGVKSDVKVLRRAVFGNTDPGQSLVVRVERLEQQLMAMRRVSWATLCGVAGILLQALANWAFRLLMP